MRLCVGATSRTVVEEAAKLEVPQIIASRRQVDIDGGYTGLTQGELVELVRRYSKHTKIVRDHGGPDQGPMSDNGVESFTADVIAGFDILHVDITSAPNFSDTADGISDAIATQNSLLKLFEDTNVQFDIGGEHVHQDVNDALLHGAFACLKRNQLRIASQVVNVDTMIKNDRQCGDIASHYITMTRVKCAHDNGFSTKAHNMDWVGMRRKRFARTIDYYNVAPEFGALEVDVRLAFATRTNALQAMQFADTMQLWRRWFENEAAGTWYDRTRCTLRYLLESPTIKELLTTTSTSERMIREIISDAIRHG